MMKLSIAGTGYVGLVSGICLAEKGHDVTCVDIDADKVARINTGEAPIFEPGLNELLQRNLDERFIATTDLRDAVLNSQVTMIAVGTPFDGQRIDLTYVKNVARQIGEVLRDKDKFHVVVVKSTVVPGTTDTVVAPILEEASGKRAGRDFGVGTNPEFLSEGTAVHDFMHPDRIVIGGSDERTCATLRELYAAFPNVPCIVTSNRAAEMIKYASNSLLATLVSFSNEIGNLCSAIGGMDAVDVFRGVHLSQYLSPALPDGTRATAPIAAFLSAGCGFGGSCLPKDVSALIQHGRDHGEAVPLLSSVIDINRVQPQRMLSLLQRHFPSLEGVDVAVLGLAFKPETDDVRESPALPIIRGLCQRGARVRAFDPIANTSAARHLGEAPIQFAGSLDEAIDGIDAAMLVTRWRQFSELPSVLAGRRPQPVLIDGRRVIDPHSVNTYEGIGL